MSAKSKPLIAEARNYLVTTVAQAKEIATSWLDEIELSQVIHFGLPEVDDRYHIWRVPLLSVNGHRIKIGEIVIDAYTTGILFDKTTKPEMLEARLLKKNEARKTKPRHKDVYPVSSLRNTIGLGDSAQLIDEMPAASVDLVFTSPPYFNARPEYSDYEVYEQYLFKMRQVIKRAHRVLNEGRFFVINCAPVLLRRATRNESSRRIAVPFDLHRIFIEEGYDFIDDIIWAKPEGAGWATGRGRRFAADRNPLQYKAVPVTEYVLVYRKRTDMLIDWHIRNHPDKNIVAASKVQDGYERTNIWRINPNTHSEHPAAFPFELAKKVVTYYTFKNDVVLDPFAGSGMTGAAAADSGRRFVLFDINPDYVRLMQTQADKWLGPAAENILHLNCHPPSKTQPHLPIEA
ncbi:MAG TPA: site-specific DNA-methyltransferase [Pyrinomonadaceae bacterium]|nr:site-specific DNA-methyltransferase [Pyrinomonadaceae bacterium]